MSHHAANDELFNAEIAEAVVELSAEKTVGAVLIDDDVCGEGLDALRDLTAVCTLVKEGVAVGVDVFHIDYVASEAAALFDEADYLFLGFLRIVELACSAFEVVVLDIDDE